MSTVRLQVSDVNQDVLDAAVAEQEDVEFENRLGNDPVTAAIIIGGGLALGKLVMRVINEIRGGTVIDLTVDPVQIKRDHALEYGFFMYIAKDGSVKIEPKDEPKDSLERMAGAILGLATGAQTAAVKGVIDKMKQKGATATIEPTVA